MMDNINAQTISNAPLDAVGLDFKFLRLEGIKHIQRLAGESWTDHNTHDPGITILDLLCYTITDLSYRINYEIKDLIAEKDEDPYKSLYSPAQILTVNPVTVLDIRKVVLDVEGVKNAWIEKVTQPKPQVYYNAADNTLNLLNDDGSLQPINITGLYRVLIEKSGSTLSDGGKIVQSVTAKLNERRGLCEDFTEIKILETQNIVLSGNIEVGNVEDINVFAANILFRVANFISPSIRFYSVEELLNEGKRVDEIFDGPALDHGFINDEELIKFDRKQELHVSDIIREMMDEPGINAIKSIALVTGSAQPEKWRLILDTEKTPKLDFDTILANLNTNIADQKTGQQYLNFIKNELQVSIDKQKVKYLFQSLIKSNISPPLNEQFRDIVPEQGAYRNINLYYSLQNHFQLAYGIGELGLPGSATVKRKAQAKQLKAYLMFFEQILANYFAQVAHTKDLFSFYNNEPFTYFSQSLIGAVPGADEILTPAINETLEKSIAALTESTNDAFDRKNRFLNHLLARFSESFTDYSLLLNELMQPESATVSEKLMNDKLNFLQKYPQISSDRGKAFNYTNESWDSDNISGLEKRIALKIGINNYNRRSIADGDEEGFHMVEHILLRPIDEDLYRFREYALRKNIEVFERSDRDGWVRCLSALHGLQSGEEIQIRGSNGYNNTFKVDRVLPDSFEIHTDFTGTGNDAPNANEFGEKTPNWIRTEIDTRFLILPQPQPILSFSASANISYTVCNTTEHDLENGERIQITGTKNYNGLYNVQNVQENSFEIEKAFTGDETTGKWMIENQRKDPYSLQLTFVFPVWPLRFQNETFRLFIENTIREETPVHLTVYILWLAKDEMTVFENSFKNFLQQLKADKNYGSL